MCDIHEFPLINQEKSRHENIGKGFGASNYVGVGGKSSGKGCCDRFIGKSGIVGVGGMSGFGGLGVGGESRIAECRKVVRFVDDGRGILDHDDEIHVSIDHSADRVKLALC
jgi:hypothetical protein